MISSSCSVSTGGLLAMSTIHLVLTESSVSNDCSWGYDLHVDEPMHEERVYAFGPFLADPLARTLHRNGEPVDLSPKSFDVLMVLIRHRGDVVDKETLLRLVWNDRI